MATPGLGTTEVEVKNILPLHEEGPLLAKKDLVAVQVEGTGIGFHLAEVGVDRQVQGQVVGHPHPGVEAGGKAVVGTGNEGVALLFRVGGALGEYVGLQLHVAVGLDVVEPPQFAEAADPS